MIKHTRAFLFMSLSFLVLLTGCGSGYTGQEPTSLQVTRFDQVTQHQAAPRVWTVTETHTVQQLFDEMQNMPMHQNQGADTCARAPYAYTLAFFVGTKSLQKDELYTSCFTLTLADGSQRDPTTTFDALFAGMLHLSHKDVIGW